MKYLLGLMMLSQTALSAVKVNSQIICDASIEHLNEKLKGEIILYEGVLLNKETEKFEKKWLGIVPKTVSAPAMLGKLFCVTVTD